jgi:putative phosphoribosyl transferase
VAFAQDLLIPICLWKGSVMPSTHVRHACVEKPVKIALPGLDLTGVLSVPESPLGMILFAHGTGNRLFREENYMVASILYQARLGSLLMDLVAQPDRADGTDVPDAEMLADRLVQAADWLAGRPEAADCALGLFGAGDGAAGALIACARKPDAFEGVVCWSGQTDLADPWLPLVEVPALLLVGGQDRAVLQANRSALDRLGREASLMEIPGNTHPMAEPGVLEQVAALARNWFLRHLAGREV